MKKNKTILKLLACTACAAFVMTAAPSYAQLGIGMSQSNSQDFVSKLTEENIQSFLEELKAISTGQRPNMSDDDVRRFLKNHLASNGTYKSSIRYEIPGFPTKEAPLKLSKEEFIESVVSGRKLMKEYKVSVDIKDLEISRSGKRAELNAHSKESGLMPVPGDNNTDEIVPIAGQSQCKEKLGISQNNYIQLSYAECTTVISFDPFYGDEFGDDDFFD